MKRSAFALLLGLGVLAQPILAFTGMSQAQAVRKNVSEYAGQRCNTPPRGSGIIVGQYTGTTDNPILSMGGDQSTVSFFRCFTSMPECQGWLYTLRSKYTDGNSVLISCKKR
ncbi:hypothetical protein J2X72_002518 [Phyllobacterium sp. 1468]|uniref:metallophosphoesterase n=1 Tax=Phyllobacterium sp. 1468 TaxID=2817759 RepID=UPI001AEB1288|nr:metallophosphoesterase [Phyllobacterium sp. 1468]MDR6633718.1 hypothetical protein [Phyllobacterium sp. 1468]